MFVFPTIYILKIVSKCDGIRGWGLWQVIRSQGQSPHEWDWCLWKRNSRVLPCVFHHVRTQKEDSCLWTRKFSLQNCGKYISVVFCLIRPVCGISLQQPKQTQLPFLAFCGSLDIVQDHQLLTTWESCKPFLPRGVLRIQRCFGLSPCCQRSCWRHPCVLSPFLNLPPHISMSPEPSVVKDLFQYVLDQYFGKIQWKRLSDVKLL